MAVESYERPVSATATGKRAAPAAGRIRGLGAPQGRSA
jgi:hypothetical protein